MDKIALFGNKKYLLSYFGPLKEKKGFELIEIIFADEMGDGEQIQGILLEFPQDNFKSVLKALPNAPIVIVFNSKLLSRQDIKNLEELCHDEEIIKGIVDTENALDRYLPILRGLISKINSQKILGNYLSRSLIHLERIKDMHRKIVPLRSGNSNGINYFSKFASGESAGGEFFNFHNKNLENMFFFSNTNSYAVSNIVLSAYEKFKFEKLDLTEFREFLNILGIEKNILNKNKLEIFMARIDRKNLKIEGYNFSSSKFFLKDEIKIPHVSLDGNTEINFSDSYFSFIIGRGERLYIFSSGFIGNMEKYYQDFNLKALVDKSQKLPAGEALNEFFFQLKRKMKGKFPFYDSSVTIIEVDENVLFQV